MGALVWKYIDFETYKIIISSRTLKLTRIDLYEDTWEGRYTGQQKEIMALANKLGIQTPHNNVFVSCWCKRSDQSMAMWDIYARTGVALLSTEEKLLGFVKSVELAAATRLMFGEKSVLVRGVRDVTYGYDPDAVRYLAKRQCFDHEKECRIFFGIIPPVNLPSSILVPFEPAGLIDKVIVSPRTSIEQAQEVERVSRELGLTAPVTRSDILD